MYSMPIDSVHTALHEINVLMNRLDFAILATQTKIKMLNADQNDQTKKKLVSNYNEFKRLRESIYDAVNGTKTESISCIVNIGSMKNCDDKSDDDNSDDGNRDDDNRDDESSDDDNSDDEFMKALILHSGMRGCKDFVKFMILSGLVGRKSEKKSDGDVNRNDDNNNKETTVDNDHAAADN